MMDSTTVSTELPYALATFPEPRRVFALCLRPAWVMLSDAGCSTTCHGARELLRACHGTGPSLSPALHTFLLPASRYHPFTAPGTPLLSHHKIHSPALTPFPR